MAENAPTILIIEDEAPIQKFLQVSLEAQGYRTVTAATAKDGLVQATSAQPDLIILDLGLPDMDGIALVRQIRAWSTLPILIVSARGKEQDKVVALDAGADDYLTKPFSVPELLARLRVALRHSAASAPDAAPVFTTGDLTVDLVHRTVTVAGQGVHLTPNEYRLLTLLVKHAGKVLTHAQILKEVWGPGTTLETHYVRVYMNQLRQKLEPNSTAPKYLLTEPGVGYRLVAGQD